MSREHYDVVVAGVGGVGAATVAHLARRGRDVLGLERFDVPHAHGSSHGESRIVRKAYFEGSGYVPLVERAYALWDELEAETGRDLRTTTGLVVAGPPGSETVTDATAACEAHGLAHERLDADALADRHPGFDLPASFEALVQPDGGFLRADDCVTAHVDAAHDAGATIRAREAVTDWRPTGDGVRVSTTRGTYAADRLVVTAGSWAGDLLPGLDPDLRVERQVAAWFRPRRPERFAPARHPVYIVDPGETEAVPDGHELYGFPRVDRPGVKAGVHHHLGGAVDPDDVPAGSPEDEAVVRGLLERHLPDAAGETLGLRTCLYTNTPDGDFVVDAHPEHPEVVIGAGFSGHGFKFAPVLGEVLADLAVDGRTEHPVDAFGFDRL